MIRMHCKPLRDLPNVARYRFVGVRHNGTLVECYIQRDPKTRTHYVAGDATYFELKGWAPA